MDEKEFKKLIKKDRYQVFLFSCPAPIPTNFAPHYWFVINKKGKISRWEVLMPSSQVKTSWDHLHKTTKHFAEGLNKIHYTILPRSKSSLVGFIEGKNGSTAQKMAKFIFYSPKKYPYCGMYNPLGPNSNTFIQWIINHFPESGFKLSWRAIGKGYKVK